MEKKKKKKDSLWASSRISDMVLFPGIEMNLIPRPVSWRTVNKLTTLFFREMPAYLEFLWPYYRKLTMHFINAILQNSR